MSVGGAPYTPSDEEDAEQLDRSLRRHGSDGIFYTTFDEDGVEGLTLRPVPSSAGDAVLLTYVFTPDDIEDGNEPPVPRNFHRAALDYARAVVGGELEDDFEGDAVYSEKFDRRVQDLLSLRHSRLARGPVQMRVQGYHFALALPALVSGAVLL